jgi:hypothetical protein
VKNNFTDEAKRVMARSIVRKRIQVKLRVFMAAPPICPSYIRVNKKSPAAGRVLSCPEGQEK